jgi:hypothetical protein
MKTILIIFYLLLGVLKSFGQIPNIKHNFSHQDSIESKVISSFAKQFDFVLAYTALSYWNGYKKEYQLLSYSKNKWQAWTYSSYYAGGTKKWWGTKWKVDSIRNRKFVKTKRTPTTTEVSALLTEFNKNDFWSLDNDSLNRIHYTYFIDENTGDTLGKRQPHMIADGTTSRFEIFTKANIKVIQAYSPNPDILERKIFVTDLNIFFDWWNKYCL